MRFNLNHNFSKWKYNSITLYRDYFYKESNRKFTVYLYYTVNYRRFCIKSNNSDLHDKVILFETEKFPLFAMIDSLLETDREEWRGNHDNPFPDSHWEEIQKQLQELCLNV